MKLLIVSTVLASSSALAPAPKPFPKFTRGKPFSATGSAGRDALFGVDNEDAMLSATRQGQDSFSGAIDVKESDPFGYVDEMKTKMVQASKQQTSFGEPLAEALGFGAPRATLVGGSGAASLALPFAARPAGLDTVALAGDCGFDPLGFSDSKERLLFMRDAELKHARLAMLAAVGWPVSELVQPSLAKLVHAESLVSPLGGEVPSVLNGGLQNVPVFFWIAAVGAAGALELAGLQAKASGAMPGDVGWRAGKSGVAAAMGAPVATGAPISPDDAVADAELVNGRVAMLAVVAYVAQEFAAKLDGLPVPVVASSYGLFHPFF